MAKLTISFSSGNFIKGRVIRALEGSWHPGCFTCEVCRGELAEKGFTRYAGKVVCRECREKARTNERNKGMHVCKKCQ
jgi:hypothetical protein